MNIIYSKTAIKSINLMDKAYKQRIKNGIEGLIKYPPEGDIKKLQGFDDNRQRLRVGKYRIIFRLEADVLVIIDIGNRGDIYK